MSGGSMDYLYSKIEYAARQIPDKEIRKLAFDFAELMHDCEWYVDCGIGEETWLKTLNTFKQKWFGKRDERLKEIINEEIDSLRTELLTMIGEPNDTTGNCR